MERLCPRCGAPLAAAEAEGPPRSLVLGRLPESGAPRKRWRVLSDEEFVEAAQAAYREPLDELLESRPRPRRPWTPASAWFRG